ncbi:MAG: hypothetical protein QNJ47_17925 [Nostocaceae cyanobacterium]|nr:hypothetical protein [Nostocaceae cyanobacterium]
MKNLMLRLILIGIVLVSLTACNSLFTPNTQLVQKAIAIQLKQTQQQLSQKLDLDFQGFEINRLSITERQPLMVQNLQTYHLQGSYDLIFQLPKKHLQQSQKPFDIYLQRQKQGKTWRLLLKDANSQDTNPVWRSYLIE